MKPLPISLARHSAEISMRNLVAMQPSQAATFSCRLLELSLPHILFEYWLHNFPRKMKIQYFCEF